MDLQDGAVRPADSEGERLSNDTAAETEQRTPQCYPGHWNSRREHEKYGLPETVQRSVQFPPGVRGDRLQEDADVYIPDATLRRSSAYLAGNCPSAALHVPILSGLRRLFLRFVAM